MVNTMNYPSLFMGLILGYVLASLIMILQAIFKNAYSSFKSEGIKVKYTPRSIVGKNDKEEMVYGVGHLTEEQHKAVMDLLDNWDKPKIVGGPLGPTYQEHYNGLGLNLTADEAMKVCEDLSEKVQKANISYSLKCSHTLGCENWKEKCPICPHK